MSTYSQAVRGYLGWYELLLSPLEIDATVEAGEAVLRLIEGRLNGLNQEAESLLRLTRPYVEGAAPHPDRAAAIDSLLYQIEGDMRVAFVTWMLMQHDPKEDLETAWTEVIAQQRLIATYRRLLLELPANFEDTAYLYRVNTAIYPHQAQQTLAEAVSELRFEIDQTFRNIWERTLSNSLRLVRHILEESENEWEQVLRGIELLKGNQKVGDIGWGLEDGVDFHYIGLATELRQTLATIVERLLSIIEKNDLVRYTIADWLEELKIMERDSLPESLTRLLQHLYQLEIFRKYQLDIWLQQEFELEGVQRAVQAVRQLGINFDRFSDEVRHLTLMIPTSELFHHPLLRSAGYAVQVGLLGMLIFAGYDYIDEGSNALNITRGVKEILIQELKIHPDLLREADRAAMVAS